MMNTISKNGLLLALFAVVCTGMVTLTYVLTAPAIKSAEIQNKFAVLTQVIPSSLHDNALVESCIELENVPSLGSQEVLQAYLGTMNGQPSAIAIETVAPNGYNGAIKLLVGFDLNQVITGVRVLHHQETPGLGDKVEKRKSDWIDGFTGAQVQHDPDTRWAVKKEGGQFDQFTGATITPRAVISAIKRTALFVQSNKDQLFSMPITCNPNQESER